MLKFLRIFAPLLILVVLVWMVLAQIAKRRTEGIREPDAPPPPFDARFEWIDPLEGARVPLAVRFDSPLGAENGALAYNAQPFRENNHLGDDLNGIGGGDSDLGDPVFAAADGLVTFAGDAGPGWGNVIMVAHAVEDGSRPGGRRLIQSLYAHLSEIAAISGSDVRRGERLGAVGTAGGRYKAHLHFEIIESPIVHPGPGYHQENRCRVSPSAFLKAHRGAPDDQLNPPPPMLREPIIEIGE
ncbi:MAG: M23 family metallopeptidase [Verrucomicrobiales bacterium]